MVRNPALLGGWLGVYMVDLEWGICAPMMGLGSECSWQGAIVVNGGGTRRGGNEREGAKKVGR